MGEVTHRRAPVRTNDTRFPSMVYHGHSKIDSSLYLHWHQRKHVFTSLPKKQPYCGILGEKLEEGEERELSHLCIFGRRVITAKPLAETVACWPLLSQVPRPLSQVPRPSECWAHKALQSMLSPWWLRIRPAPSCTITRHKSLYCQRKEPLQWLWREKEPPLNTSLKFISALPLRGSWCCWWKKGARGSSICASLWSRVAQVTVIRPLGPQKHDKPKAEAGLT